MYLKISNCPVHHFPPKIDKTIVLKLSIVWFLIMYNTYTLIVFHFFPNLPAYLNFDLISVSASYKTPSYKKECIIIYLLMSIFIEFSYHNYRAIKTTF